MLVPLCFVLVSGAEFLSGWLVLSGGFLAECFVSVAGVCVFF